MSVVMLLVQRNFCHYSTLILRLIDKPMRGQQSSPCLTATILKLPAERLRILVIIALLTLIPGYKIYSVKKRDTN